MIRRLLPLVAFMALAVLLAVGVRMNAGRDTSALPSPLIGKPAPDFALPVLGDPARLISGAELRGAPYLLNVWGSWCPACQVEHPIISEFAKTSRVKVIGYNYKDEATDAQRWLAQFGNPYALVLVDLQGHAALDWGIYGAPETFLIDAQGIVRWKHVGPIDQIVLAEELLPALEALP